MLPRKAASLDASLLERRKGVVLPLLAAQPSRAVLAPPPHPVAATVRLKDDLHLRLRLLAAHTGRSRQDILRAAIEEYLAAR